MSTTKLNLFNLVGSPRLYSYLVVKHENLHDYQWFSKELPQEDFFKRLSSNKKNCIDFPDNLIFSFSCSCQDFMI